MWSSCQYSIANTIDRLDTRGGYGYPNVWCGDGVLPNMASELLALLSPHYVVITTRHQRRRRPGALNNHPTCPSIGVKRLTRNITKGRLLYYSESAENCRHHMASASPSAWHQLIIGLLVRLIISSYMIDPVLDKQQLFYFVGWHLGAAVAVKSTGGTDQTTGAHRPSGDAWLMINPAAIVSWLSSV